MYDIYLCSMKKITRWNHMTFISLRNRMYYCYLIHSQNQPRMTYIGITNDLNRRLQQHNGVLQGGAKATRRFCDWQYIMWIQLKDHRTAAQLEWKWKQQHGLESRVAFIQHIINDGQLLREWVHTHEEVL